MRYEVTTYEVTRRIIQFAAQTEEDAREIVEEHLLSGGAAEIMSEDRETRAKVVEVEPFPDDEPYSFYAGPIFPGADWGDMKERMDFGPLAKRPAETVVR